MVWPHGHAARNVMRKWNGAATRIESRWRGILGRRRWHRELEDQSATKLQQVVRMYSGGFGSWRCIKSALVVQRRYRMIRANGNWVAAMLIRRKIRLCTLIARM